MSDKKSYILDLLKGFILPIVIAIIMAGLAPLLTSIVTKAQNEREAIEMFKQDFASDDIRVRELSKILFYATFLRKKPEKLRSHFVFIAKLPTIIMLLVFGNMSSSYQMKKIE